MVEKLRKVPSLDDEKKEEFARRYAAGAIDRQEQHIRVNRGSASPRTKTMREKELEYASGYTNVDPHASIARDISPKRTKPEPEPEEDEAAALYRKWRDEVFAEHERTKRSASNSSAKARQEQEAMSSVTANIKSNQAAWTDGVERLNKNADVKLDEIRKQEKIRQERRDEYIKWHIKKYGKPPNPNFFRTVDSPSPGRVRQRSASPRNARRDGSAKKVGGLAAITMMN